MVSIFFLHLRNIPGQRKKKHLFKYNVFSFVIITSTEMPFFYLKQQGRNI